MVFNHSSYRTFLKDVLLEKNKKNPSFSLRAMARSLDVQPSLFSEVLSGKRHLTEETAVRIGEKLGLGERERLYFRLLVQLGRAKSPQVEQLLLAQLDQANPAGHGARDLSVDHFLVISDWQHFALLRLLEIEAFEFSPRAAAEALGVHHFEVEAALERLISLELVEKTAGGAYRKVSDDLRVASSSKNEALRKYHRQMLEKTIEALDAQSPDERYTGTETLVLEREQLGEARAIFEECFEKILKLSQRRKSRNPADVFHLGIHMLRLSQIKKRRKQS